MQHDAVSPARLRLATLLDLLAIVAIAAAAVLALGTQSRFRLLFVVITIGDPLRPLIGAALTVLLRLAVAGRAPLLPAWRLPGTGARLEHERRRLAERPPLTREVKYYAAAAMLGSLVWLSPHLLHMRRVPDAGDPIFSTWRLAMLAHQLTHDPADLFDGNILYPARDTLTYSDSTFLQGVAATPFLVAGLDPLVVANAVFLSAFPLCALAFFYTGWRLTADPRAGMVAGLMGGLFPFHLEHYSHLELQFFCFVPLALLALLRMIAAPRLATGAVFGAWVAVQWLTSMYFGVMLLVFLLPVAVIAVAAWGLTARRQALQACTVAGLIIAIAFGALSVPYMRSQASRGERPLKTVAEYSATPADYARPHARLASYQWMDRAGNLPERELFPGLTPLVLGAVGAIPPLGVAGIATMAAAAIAFDGSLGLNGLIYDDLYRHVLPFRGMRVPARFAALAGTGLILLSAFGCARLFRILPVGLTRMGAAVVLGAAVMIDLRPTLQLHDYPATAPSIYAAVTPDMVLAEFPMVEGANISYMYFSTSHWARMLNGYSGYLPDTYIALQESMGPFPLEGTLDRLRSAGATHVTVNCRLWANPPRCEGVLTWLDRDPTVRLVNAGVWENAPVRIYAIR